MYIFPGLGFGAFLAQARNVSDKMIVAASTTLAKCVTEEELKEGRIYPRLNKIREISKDIATAVIETAFEEVKSFPSSQFSPFSPKKKRSNLTQNKKIKKIKKGFGPS